MKNHKTKAQELFTVYGMPEFVTFENKCSEELKVVRSSLIDYSQNLKTLSLDWILKLVRF